MTRKLDFLTFLEYKINTCIFTINSRTLLEKFLYKYIQNKTIGPFNNLETFEVNVPTIFF